MLRKLLALANHPAVKIVAASLLAAQATSLLTDLVGDLQQKIADLKVQAETYNTAAAFAYHSYHAYVEQLPAEVRDALPPLFEPAAAAAVVIDDEPPADTRPFRPVYAEENVSVEFVELDSMSSFSDDGTLDTDKGMILVMQGKKRSGKSVMGLFVFRSFPGDKAVIDIAGDDGPEGPGVIEIRGTVEDLPREWPEHLRPGKNIPMILRYVPDPKSETYLEDIDAFIGMVLAHSTKEKPVMLLVHESGVAFRANRTKPHSRAALMHNRHHGLNEIHCTPRAMDVEPLVLAQADLVYTFEMPSKADRDRTAEQIGWGSAEFTEAMRELGPHEYLRFDANELQPPPAPAGTDPDVWEQTHPDWRLIHFDALPPEVVQETLRWAHNVPAHPLAHSI